LKAISLVIVPSQLSLIYFISAFHIFTIFITVV